ncbi:UNVERIFIED_CONTAM: hypothetical protein Sradi_6904200 [Sesamum radiatum]|uniref:Uncharacterized protein n=1 Tax=Sesamum radiatum TaxID=300843 RepID=A0AAW2JI55_SESRA
MAGELAPCELVIQRARTLRARSLRPGQVATWRACTLRARGPRSGELAPSELVGWRPCRLAGCWSSRPASWVP